MKLFEGWSSSASWRVRWALALKPVPYESVWLDVAAGEHLDVLASINPLRTVPTLVLDDGHVLTESVAIIEWLDETRPRCALLPSEPRRRARVRELVQLINADVHPLQNTIVRRAISSVESAQHAWASRWIERGLTAYEAQLRGSSTRFSVGDEITMADLYLVPQLVNAARFGADIRACVRAREVAEAALATAEAQATHPHRAALLAAAARAESGEPTRESV